MQLLSSLWMPAVLPCASIDSDVAHWFRQHLTPHFVDVLWAMTTPGSALFIAAVLAACLGVLASKKRWFTMATLTATVGGGSLFGETLKLIVERPRPFVAGPWGPWGGYSFPSGHTIAATLLYGFLALAMLRFFQRRRWRILSAFAGGLLILGVGFSRIALGAHYLSDVLGAMTIGSAWILLCPLLLNILHTFSRPLAAPTREMDLAPDTQVEEAALEPALAE